MFGQKANGVAKTDELVEMKDRPTPSPTSDKEDFVGSWLCEKGIYIFYQEVEMVSLMDHRSLPGIYHCIKRIQP
jgi:hypothetical protein